MDTGAILRPFKKGSGDPVLDSIAKTLRSHMTGATVTAGIKSGPELHFFYNSEDSMSDIKLRSFQTILGSMAARLMAETDLNDVNPGGVMLTILEAAASSDFQTEAKLAQLIGLRSVDKASGLDLENLAFEMGVTPNRISATASNVILTIFESSFTKAASNIYAGSNSPVAGDTTLKVVNGASFASSGSIYIGRGTKTSEAANYVSLINTGTYWLINLASPLSKDHLVGEPVVFSQGGKRIANAGSIVFINGIGLAPAIEFIIQQDAILEDGEDQALNVLALASVPGITGNVGAKKISQFRSSPWTTAGVTNPTSATGGTDAETDPDLRQRIKDNIHNLASGTERAIIRAVIGAVDNEENKRVVSAFLRKPSTNTDPTLLFIDDGTGFQPSFSGVGEEVIVPSAIGSEQILQLQAWPLVKTQVASVGTEPFALVGGETLYVEVDGTSEQISLPATYYQTPGVVTAQQISEVINANFKTIEARAKDGQLFLSTTSYDPDYIRVGVPSSGTDANSIIRFPVTKQFTIKLYKNDVLLEKNGTQAIIQSLANSAWTGILSPATTSNPETLQFSIDNILSPVLTFNDLDFTTYTSSQTAASSTVSDWVILINRKTIGVTAAARDDGTFTVKSNRGATSAAEIAVVGGSLATKLFPANLSSTGASAQYNVNRQNGTITLSSRLSVNDEVKAGTVNTRGFIYTNAQASFDLSPISGNAAQIVVIADAPYIAAPISETGTVTFSAPTNSVTRITGATAQFSNVNVNDIVHLYGVLPRTGLLRVISVATNGSSVDLADPAPQFGTATLNGSTSKIRFFRTTGLPQLITLPLGNSISSVTLASSIQSQVMGLTAVSQDNNSVKIQTTRYELSGALAIPSVCGSAVNLGIAEGNYLSNDPHVASLESANLTGIPSKRLTSNIPSTVYPYSNLSVNSAPFDFTNHNRPVLTYLGANSKLIRQPSQKVDASDLTLRTTLPVESVGLGPDMRATTLSGVEFGQADNMVFLIDNDPSTKTFDVPMYVSATVSGPSVPSTSQFDLIDSTGASLWSSTRWLEYKFEDYRVWFQSKANMPNSTANADVRITSVSYGPNGQRIFAAINYPAQASSSVISQYTVNPSSDSISLGVFLGSGSPRIINLQPNKRIAFEAVGSAVKYKFLPPVDLTPVQVGDLVNLQDLQFQAANRGPVYVAAISNLVDNGNAYQFPTDSITVNVIAGQSLTLSAALASHLAVGDKVSIGSVSALITVVTSQTSITVASPGFTDGPNQSGILTHGYLQASNTPSFAVQVDDTIVVGSFIMTVVAVLSATQFTVDQPLLFTGLQSGNASRITISGSHYSTGTSESFNAQNSTSLIVYPLDATKNAASAIIASINGTAGVKDIVVASNKGSSTGAGIIKKSTEDELSNGQTLTALQNGENFVYSMSTTSPSVHLKESIALAPEIGDAVRLVPMTPQNLVDHLSKKQITGLTVAADVALVDEGRRLQVSSKTSGADGQVFAVGGRASGSNVLAVRGNVQEISSTRAQIELDRSSIDLLVPGSTVCIYQPGRAKKKFTAAQPLSTTNVQVAVTEVGVGRLTTGVPLVTIYPYTQASPQWAVRNIGRNRIRFEIFAGNATLPSALQVNDWVLVGNGISYAGITTDTAFAPANQGWFQIRETDNANYFDVDGQGVEQFVNTTSASFIFTAYHSARPGDQLVIGFDSPFSTVNKGTFNIVSVPSTSSVVYANVNVLAEGPLVLGVSGTSSVSILDQSYMSYRQVIMVAPKPTDPTNRALLVVSPGTDLGLINEGQGAKISFPNRLGFGTDPVPGVNGYNYWTGLLRKVSRIISGYAPDSATYPGVAAAGIDIDPRPPQINQVALALIVKTSRGVSLQAISDTIKSAIEGYVNSLGLGQAVILSEVVKLVQTVPGVDSCVLTSPLPSTERITVGDSAVPRISATAITLS